MKDLYKLFFISPIIAFFMAVKHSNTFHGRNVLILFFGFFGLIMIFPEGTDGFRHGMNVVNHYFDLSFVDFIYESGQLLIFNPVSGTNDDLYLHLISYLAGLFQNSQLLYFFAAIIYGYFFANSLSRIAEVIEKKSNFFIIVLFLSFVLYKSFEGINSIRNYTGAWCLFYTTLSYVTTRNKRFLYLLIIPPFIHFAHLDY